ncbi:exosortase family protein XrtF [Apibacter muscae]|uniref:Exosortase family protein XrtF n=1 Tax=Apibacter muscae TaxID=2509004 RepID=A0A563DG85_9FLAO|nr:exosortase family protein XrtF [Apibacter muscae]TWP29092.1 exosortase family protein XrtF [Apibacter muscae]TWP30327.1 exosortase family protein XrtF [Apibacter muscae]
MKEYKSILIVLVKFFCVYLVLIGLYYLYLNFYQNKLQTCDPYTEIVAKQSATLLNFVSVNSMAIHINHNNFMFFAIDSKISSIVNEGCNALSVIILYIAFIIAFANTWRNTTIFLLSSVLIIYITNLIRIAFLNYIFHTFPSYSNLAHDYIFPVIIYGIIIFFWMVWIKFFVLNKPAYVNDKNN